MQFDSVQHLLQMGGHGVFVWPAVVASSGVLLWLVIEPLRRQRALFREVSRELRRARTRDKIPD